MESGDNGLTDHCPQIPHLGLALLPRVIIFANGFVGALVELISLSFLLSTQTSDAF